MLEQRLAAYWASPAGVQRTLDSATMTFAERLAWLDVLRRHLKAGGRRLHVLDVGAGTGYMARLLAQLSHQVTALDLSTPMLAAARQQTDSAETLIAWRQGDALALEFPDDHFDVVVARHVLTVLAQPVKALREWQRILKKDGRLLLIEDYLTSAADRSAAQLLRGPLPAVLRTLPLAQASPADLADFARLAGFTHVTQTPLRGQLERQKQRGWRVYRLGYTLVIAQQQTSVPLPTSPATT